MPGFRLVLEVVIKHLGLVGWMTDGLDEKMFDFPLQNGIGLETHGIEITFFLQQTMQGRIGEGHITAKELRRVQMTIPLDHGQQHSPPVQLSANPSLL